MHRIWSHRISKIRTLCEEMSLEISSNKIDMLRRISNTFLDPYSLFADEFVASIASEEGDKHDVWFFILREAWVIYFLLFHARYSFIYVIL